MRRTAASGWLGASHPEDRHQTGRTSTTTTATAAAAAAPICAAVAGVGANGWCRRRRRRRSRGCDGDGGRDGVGVGVGFGADAVFAQPRSRGSPGTRRTHSPILHQKRQSRRRSSRNRTSGAALQTQRRYRRTEKLSVCVLTGVAFQTGAQLEGLSVCLLTEVTLQI